MIDKITGFLENAIERHVFPGCSVAIIANKQRWCGSFGAYTYEPGSQRVLTDTIYDVASITKAVPVSSLALKLIGEGMTGMDKPLIDLVPEFTGGYRESITVRHLLTQTLDFGFRLSDLKHLGGEAVLNAILAAPMRSAPGEVYSYANATSILLGLFLERLTGVPLDEAAQFYLFGPLAMESTTFHPDRFDSAKIVPTEDDPWRGRVIRAEVHDESAFLLRPGIVGSAGLFSTASDLLSFAAMLLSGGTVKGKRLFSPDMLAMMHTDALPGRPDRTGYGWELNQPVFMGKLCSGTSFGKTGFTGCSMLIDPERAAAVVLLSNHTWPHRRKDRSIINGLRAGLADIVFGHIDGAD